MAWFGFQFDTDTTELSTNSGLITHVSAQLREGTLYMSEAGVLETSETHQTFQAYCHVGRSLNFFFRHSQFYIIVEDTALIYLAQFSRETSCPPKKKS